MGVVRQILGLDRVPLDPAMGDSELGRARQALFAGDFAPASEVLAGRGLDDRSLCAAALGEWPQRPAAIDAWLEQRPADAGGWVVSAENHVHLAWEARGGGRASTVTESGWRGFHEGLAAAEEHLARAARCDEADAAPHALGITVAMGASLSKDIAWERYHMAVERAPLHYHAHYSLLSYLCKKWHGSHEEMFAVAREAAAAAPGGHPLHGLVARAHVERCAECDSDSERRAYWRTEDVRQETQQAADQFLQDPDASSPTVAAAGNFLAFGLCMFDDNARATAVFEVIGDRPTSNPWHYIIGKPGAVFGAWRRDARRGR